MRGLLRCNWLYLRGTLLLVGIFSMLLALPGVFLLYCIGFFYPLFLLSPSIALSIFGIVPHRNNTWETTVGTLPLPRRALVHEKYLFALILDGVSTVLYIVTYLPGCMLRGELREMFAWLMIVIASGLLAAIVNLPMLFRFGPQNMLKTFIPSIIVMWGLSYFVMTVGEIQPNGPASNSQLSLVLAVVFLLVTAAAFAVSWALSVRIHDRYDTF